MIIKGLLNASKLASGSGHEWIAASYLLSPLVVGSLLGGAFTYLIRRLGWLPNVISVVPISTMFGVLSYAVLFVIDFTFGGMFTSTWAGLFIALFWTWPIALVLGPVCFFYIANLKKGRKILKDSTILLICVLCLLAEVGFLFWFDGSSRE
jgi:hypothetical protein